MTKETLKSAELQAELEETAARLAESESRYHMLTEQSPDNILIHDLEGKILFTNASRAGVFGASSAEELIGRNAMELIHPDDHERVAGIIGGALEDFKAGKDSKRTVEQRLLRLDGTEFLGESTGVVFIYNGEPAIQAVIRDITERKETEEALKESLQRHQSLFENMLSGAAYHKIVLDEDGLPVDYIFLEVNSAFEEHTGLARDTVMGRAVTEVIPGIKEADPDLISIYGTVAKTGEGTTFDLHFPPLGKWFSVSVYCPERGYFVSIFSDITERKRGEKELRRLKESLEKKVEQRTAKLKMSNKLLGQEVAERKRAEEALKESEERWQQIADNSNDFMMIIDTKSVIQYINRLMPGLTMEQVIGSNIIDWVPEDYKSTIASCVEGVFRTGDIGWYETEYVASDGTLTKFESRVGPICTNGKITELVVSAGDVTKRFNAEKEKEALYAQLLQAQKMEAIGTLAGGIAHDFNNILTVVKSLSSLALSKVPDDSPLKEYFTPIQCASDRGASLIQQLMIFAQSRPPEVVELDINESIGGLLGMLSSLIDADISIEEELGEGVWTVEGDRGRLEQVVTNLILNASDALVQGGQIVISTENVTVTKERTPMVGDVAPGRYVRLTIEDDGMGMAPEVVAHIFDPFFTTKSPAGTGLGLSVVYGIIKEMRGGIEVSSEPRLGAKFSVYLPALDAPIATSVLVEAVGEADTVPCSAGAASVAVGGAGEAVLLVEDDEWVRSSTALALRENGYAVTEAADADSALRLVESAEGRFALILSDVVMPGRDGLQMVDDLLQVTPNVPVLFYSGHIDDRARLDSILKRGFAFLQKPYEVPDLLEAVKTCMAEG